MGLLITPGRGILIGPGGGVVRRGGAVVAPDPNARRIEPIQVSFLSSALPGQKIADLVFHNFEQAPVETVGEFSDEFTLEYGSGADEVSGYDVALISDAGGRVALAGSWSAGYSLVVGTAVLSGSDTYTLTLMVGSFPESHAITVRIAEDDVAAPQTLFTAAVENADSVDGWPDQEMQAGLPFVRGDVPAGSIVAALVDGVQIPCQLSCRVYWRDGSLKFAQARWLMPAIPAGQSKVIAWRKQPGAWTAQDTALHTSPTAVTGKVALQYGFTSWRGRGETNVLTPERGPKLFRSADLLSAANAAAGWVSPIMAGPVCSEWRATDMAVLPSGLKDAHFGAMLYARAWGGTPNSPKRIQFLFRTMYGWSTAVAADEQGIQVDIDLRVNDTVVRGATAGTPGWSAVKSWLGGFLTSAGTSGAMDWYDVAANTFVTPPRLVYRHNVGYAVASKLYPPYDTGNPAFQMAITPAAYLPGKRGPLRAVQNAAGDSAMDSWTTAKPLANLIAAHARGAAAEVALHAQHLRAAGFGMGAMTGIGHYRETRKILSYLPAAKSTNQAALGPTIYGQGKPASVAAGYRPEITGLDAAKFPQMAYPCYLTEGDQHWLDLAYAEATLPAQFDTNAAGFFGTSSRAQIPFGGIVFKGQERAVSTAILPVGTAMAIGNPSDPHHVLMTDIFAHWVEMTREVVLEEDAIRGGLDRTDGRRLQDLKLLSPAHEPSYRIWQHSLGLHVLSYIHGISESATARERAEWWSHAPTVMAGGWHNDANPLLKPDPIEALASASVVMNGLTDIAENRRPWLFGQWRGAPSAVTYKSDGQTVDFGAAVANGLIVTVSGVRAATEPYWVTDNTKVPSGLTRGVPYYTVAASGTTAKLSLSPGGAVVPFNTGGLELVGQVFRATVFGVHPMRPATAAPTEPNSNLVLVLSALDIFQHYVAPSDGRIFLARQNLFALKAGTSAPNSWDERGKFDVPRPIPWTLTGPGGMTVQLNPDRLTITSPSTTPTVVQRPYTVVPGTRYQFSFSSVAPIRRRLGSTAALGDILPSAVISGPVFVTFTAETSTVWVTFETVAAGTVTVADVTLAVNVWTASGPGQVVSTIEDAVTITASGAGATSAERRFPTDPGAQYRITFLTDQSVVYTVEETE